jgi:hypothetical protein
VLFRSRLNRVTSMTAPVMGGTGEADRFSRDGLCPSGFHGRIRGSIGCPGRFREAGGGMSFGRACQPVEAQPVGTGAPGACPLVEDLGALDQAEPFQGVDRLDDPRPRPLENARERGLADPAMPIAIGIGAHHGEHADLVESDRLAVGQGSRNHAEASRERHRFLRNR